MSAPALQITLLGAGAMGSLFGGLLAEAGLAVRLIDVHDARLATLQTHGLVLDTERGRRRIAVVASRPEAAHGAADLLVVFTKSQHTRAALAGVAHLIGPHTHVLTLQNGLGNAECIVEQVPAERVLVGITTCPADLHADGAVHSQGRGSVRLMSWDGQHRPAVTQCVQALRAAGFEAEADPAVQATIWEKVAFNAALNPLCAVTGCSVDGLARHPDGPRLAAAVVDEVLAVAQALSLPVQPARVQAQVQHAMQHHIGHKASMLQDLEGGRPTEIDAINGAVVRHAAALGLAVPHTAALATLVRLIESRRKGTDDPR